MLQDTITAQLAAIQTGETQVLTAAITQAFNDGVASVGSPTGDVTAAQEQVDIAAAVTTATAPLNDQIIQMGLAKSAEDTLLASVKAQVAAILSALA